MAFFARSEPRGAPPTGWALAFDAAVAVGAAIGAVYEMAERSVGATVMVAVPGYDPFGGPVPLPPAGSAAWSLPGKCTRACC